MATSYFNQDVFSEILPGLRQYEATTGRRVSDAVLRSLFKSQLEEAGQRTEQARRYDMEYGLRREEADARKRAEKKQAQAAKVSGIAQVGTSAATLGLLYKGGFFSKAATPAVTATAPTATAATAPAVVGTTGAGVTESSLATVSSGLLPAAVGFGVGNVTARAMPGASIPVKRVSSAATGAVTGAMVGSVVPGVGTALGALIGGGSGFIGGAVGGKK